MGNTIKTFIGLLMIYTLRHPEMPLYKCDILLHIRNVVCLKGMGADNAEINYDKWGADK